MKRLRISTECEMDHSCPIPNVNDNSNALLKKIQNVYANRLLNDITLVVGGISYPAHRFILRLSSDVFETMLMNSTSDSHKEIIELKEESRCIGVFKEFLQYFYTGVIPPQTTIIVPMLVLADKYNVKDLTAQCVEFMCEHIADAAVQGQLATWFQYVLSLNQPTTVNALYYCKIWQDTECIDIKPPWNKLLKACRNYIKWNLDSCIKCFNTFQHDILVGLLKQSDLVVHDEMQLFGYVASWLNYQSEELLKCNDSDVTDGNMSSLTKHVMSFIRYPMFLPRQMAQLLMVPIVKQNKDFFVDELAAAMEYHSVKTEKRSDTENILECTPRLYTCEKWGNYFRISTKTITNYQSIKREMVTHSSLFDRSLGLNEKSNWEIDFYLKGMRSHGSIELSKAIIKTVRATIKIKWQPDEIEKVARHVRVAILVYAVQNKIVHVMTVVQKVVLFDTNQNLITIDDLMVYDAINQPTTNEDLIRINDTNVSYFISNRLPLKFHVLITPIVPGLTDTHIGTTIQHIHI